METLPVADKWTDGVVVAFERVTDGQEGDGDPRLHLGRLNHRRLCYQ